MRCPSLDELPPPPSEKRGWPWTESCPREPPTRQDGQGWPLISIVTPSYNQGAYLEETIRSILLQGYPNLEYVVIDGGSSDGSRDIIRKYEPWLSFWVSEPDRGQPSAINKGLQHISGEIFNWINSDDVLLPECLWIVADTYRNWPDALLAGDVLSRYESSGIEERASQTDLDHRRLIEFWNYSASIHPQGIFIPMQLMNKVGTIDETLSYAFDYDLFIRLTSIAKVAHIERTLAVYRYHAASKSVAKSHCFLPEICSVSRKYWGMMPDLDFPASDPQGAGLLFRVGCWQIVHGAFEGIGFIKEGWRIDPLRAISANLRYVPQWLWNRSRQQNSLLLNLSRYLSAR